MLRNLINFTINLELYNLPCYIPIQVAGVVGRAELLCAAFFFLSFLTFHKSTNVKGSTWKVLSLIFSIILCAISMLCKEQGITVLVSKCYGFYLD